MKTMKFGGDEPLAKCGKNSVTGLVFVWDIDKKVKPKKPNPKKYPGLGSGWLSGFKHNKTLKKLKARIKAAKEKWNKQEKDWKAARKKALKDVEKQARTNVRNIAKEYAKKKIDARSCTHPDCKKKEWDGDVDLDVKSDAFAVSDNEVEAWAYCEWTATPLCKKEGEEKKKEKDHGFYVPKKLDIPVAVAWLAVASESGLTPDDVTSEHTADNYVWLLDPKAEARHVATEPTTAIRQAAKRQAAKPRAGARSTKAVASKPRSTAGSRGKKEDDS